MTVITAIEFDDLVAFGISTCQPQRRHGRFGPGIDEADHLDVRHELHDLLRQIELQRTRRAIGCPLDRGCLDCSYNIGMCMARDEWSPGEDVVNVAVTIHIEQIWS